MRSALLVLVGLLLGLLGGWWLFRPLPPVLDGAALAQQLPGGATVLERAPDAPVPADTRRAAEEAGGQLERAVRVIVQPEPIPAPAEAGSLVAAPSPPGGVESAPPARGCSCPPVTVDLGLVRMPDRTRRVVASSPDGIILGGLDIPVEQAFVGGADTRWSAMAYYMPTEKAGLVTIEREVWRGRVGAGAMLYHGKVVPMVGAGWSW